MNKIPTAEEMEMSGQYDDYQSMMRAFARLHVKAAIRAITEAKYDRAPVKRVDELTEETLRNFYPLQNIQ